MALLLGAVTTAWLAPLMRTVHAAPRHVGLPQKPPSRAESQVTAPPHTTQADRFAPGFTCTPSPAPGPVSDGLALGDGCQSLSETPGTVSEIFALDLPAWEDPSADPPPEMAAQPEPAPTAEASSLPVSAAGLSWPAAGALTSLFGPAHPLGIDIALSEGTPIVSAGDGRVALAGYDVGYGYFVLINHPGGYATLYGHLLQPAEVTPGQWVQRGQRIGFAGSTGHSTGPHLHFEVRRYNMLLNPLDVLPRVPLPIDPIALRPAPPPPAAPPTATPAPSANPSPPPPPLSSTEPAGPTEDTPPADPAPTPAGTPAPVRPTATATPRPVITATPLPTPSPTPSPTPTPSPPATPTRTLTPTATPLPPGAGPERTNGAPPSFGPAEGAPFVPPGGW